MPLIIPSPAKKKDLRQINALLRKYKETDSIKPLAEAVQIILTDQTFGATIKHNTSLPKKYETAGDLMKLAWAYLYHFLSLRDYVAAAMILWDEETFTPEPGCVQLIWGALFEGRMIAIIGSSATGKTYSPSAFFLLDWILDPEWTRIQIASASEDHLKRNLFADIVRLHSGASLPLPGVPDSEGISLNKRSGMGIFTIVLPGGPNAKAKIKGAHTKPRPLHPLFGRRSRVFMLIDEAQEVPQNVFGDIPNRFATALKGDVEHIKFVVCANPKEPFSAFGKACTPVGGLASIPMSQDKWKSQEGWDVISINAMKHENVVQKRQVHPGFVSYEGVQVLLQKCHGDDQHPDMFTLVYGRFPPQGTLSTIIQKPHIEASYRDWVFDSNTESAVGFDPAYTGDRPALATGRTGRAIAWIGYDGQRHELSQPKMALQIDSIGSIPRGDTQDMTDEVCARLKQLNVRPERYGQDTTGNGIGTHDLIRRQWSKKVGTGGLPEDAAAPITGINFAQSPTEIKIAEEDTETPKEMYDIIASELWYAAAKLFECDCVGIGRGVPIEAIEELSARRGSSKAGKGRKRSAESKDSYKSRTGKGSPDCFIAGTMILTPQGERPIELMRNGDLVCTPFGHTPVVFIHENECDELYAAKFSHGRSLIGKGKHGIFTWDSGWQRLDSLSLTNHFESASNLWIWNILNRLFTKVGPISFKTQVTTIKTGTKIQPSDFYTGLSGLKILAPFQMAWKFITRTEIGRIIHQATWNCFLRPITCGCICTSDGRIMYMPQNSGLDSKKQGLPHRLGMAPQRDWHGILKTQNRHGQKEPETKNVYAMNAEKSFFHSRMVVQSARLDVRSGLDSERQAKPRGRALCAEIISWLQNTLRQNTALISAPLLLPGRKEKVFNLTLQEHNVYYANGILVKNCADAVNILFHVARITTPGLIPKARDTKIEPAQRGPLFKEEEVVETSVSIAGWGDHQTLELMQD